MFRPSREGIPERQIITAKFVGRINYDWNDGRILKRRLGNSRRTPTKTIQT